MLDCQSINLGSFLSLPFATNQEEAHSFCKTIIWRGPFWDATIFLIGCLFPAGFSPCFQAMRELVEPAVREMPEYNRELGPPIVKALFSDVGSMVVE